MTGKFMLGQDRRGFDNLDHIRPVYANLIHVIPG